jgi:hypothetical protein
VPLRLRVSDLAVMGLDLGTKILSKEVVPERVVQLDLIQLNRAGSRHCMVARFR